MQTALQTRKTVHLKVYTNPSDAVMVRRRLKYQKHEKAEAKEHLTQSHEITLEWLNWNTPDASQVNLTAWTSFLGELRNLSHPHLVMLLKFKKNQNIVNRWLENGQRTQEKLNTEAKLSYAQLEIHKAIKSWKYWKNAKKTTRVIFICLLQTEYPFDENLWQNTKTSIELALKNNRTVTMQTKTG